MLLTSQSLPSLDPSRGQTLLSLAVANVNARAPSQARGGARRPERTASFPISLTKTPAQHPGPSFGKCYEKPFHVAYEDIAIQRNLRKIENLFFQADEDGSGRLDLDEFHKALKHPQMRGSFAAVGVQPHQATIAFDAFDQTRSGQLNLEEFMSGLRSISAPGSDGTSPDFNVKMLRAVRRRRVEAASRPSTAPVPRTTSAGRDRVFLQKAIAQALHPAYSGSCGKKPNMRK